MRKASGRILFARIGWMHFYQGLMPGDEEIRGGGAYNRENVGSELYNFKPLSGRLYGYAQPPRPGYATKLERIDVAAAEAPELKHVLVVFVAKGPGVGQVVVGWYRDATVLRAAKPDPRRRHRQEDERLYNFICEADSAVLLPDDKRTHRVPAGDGGIGQSNLCYPHEIDGSRKGHRWIHDAVEYVNDYAGTNLLTNPFEQQEREAVRAFENIQTAGQGQGWVLDAEQRRAVELAAMARAETHFRKHYAVVADVSATRSYDLHCSGGNPDLKVEVKGTTGAGETVFLTRREVELAKKGGCALFVLHSIAVRKKKASGGKAVVYWPWDLKKGQLQPMAFSYRLPCP